MHVFQSVVSSELFKLVSKGLIAAIGVLVIFLIFKVVSFFIKNRSNQPAQEWNKRFYTASMLLIAFLVILAWSLIQVGG